MTPQRVCISVCAHVSFQDTSWCSRILPYSVALLCCPAVLSPGLSLPERKRCETTQRTGTKAQEHQERHKNIKTATKPLRQQGSRVVYICTTSLLYIYIYTTLQVLNNGLNNSNKAPGLLEQSRQTQTVIHGLGQKRPTMAKRDLLLAQSRQTQTVIHGLDQQDD